MKNVKGYKGRYKACNSGKICSTFGKKERYLKPWIMNCGYEVVMLYRNKEPKKFLVHRLIAQTLIPNPNNLPEVNHIDGNKLNNQPHNLEWVTSGQNKQHAIKLGKYKKLFSLNENQIVEIRNLHEKGIYTQAQLSRKFNTPESNISCIISRKTWKHI